MLSGDQGVYSSQPFKKGNTPPTNGGPTNGGPTNGGLKNRNRGPTIGDPKKIVYVIGHRSADEYRVRNLKLTTEWLLRMKDVLSKMKIDLNIVVVEQDREPTVDKILPISVNYIFAFNPRLYNRGWGFNVAVRKYDADYYFFSDNDIVMSTDDALSVFTSCFQFEAVNPYENIYDTKDTINKDVLESFYSGKSDVEHLNKYVEGKRLYTCFSGGIVGLSKEAIVSISGWDERFRGRGWEDYAMTSKMKLFLNDLNTYSFEALHLYHPLETNTSKLENEKLDNEYETYTPQNYSSMIINTSETFGSLRKYDRESKDESPTEKIEDEKFIFGLDKDAFYKRFVNANKIYKNLEIKVIEKHSTTSDKGEMSSNIKRIVYGNLSDQHDCRLHKECNCKDCKCKDCKCGKDCKKESGDRCKCGK